MKKKIALSLLSLGLVAGATQAQTTTNPITILRALPASSCYANVKADEALLQRSMQGLTNTSSTRTVWVTCSIPIPRVIGPWAPYNDPHIANVDMDFRTSLARVTMPCKVYMDNYDAEADVHWGTGMNDGTYGRTRVTPLQYRWPSESFAIQCKIPQRTGITLMTVRLFQDEFVPME